MANPARAKDNQGAKRSPSKTPRPQVTAQTVDLSQRADTVAEAVELSELDQVRHILFGSVVERLERRIDALESHIEKTGVMLREELGAQVSKTTTQLAALRESLNEESGARESALRELNQHTESRFEDLESAIEETKTEIRSELTSHASRLEDVIDEQTTDLRAGIDNVDAARENDRLAAVAAIGEAQAKYAQLESDVNSSGDSLGQALGDSEARLTEAMASNTSAIQSQIDELTAARENDIQSATQNAEFAASRHDKLQSQLEENADSMRRILAEYDASLRELLESRTREWEAQLENMDAARTHDLETVIAENKRSEKKERKVFADMLTQIAEKIDGNSDA